MVSTEAKRKKNVKDKWTGLSLKKEHRNRYCNKRRELRSKIKSRGTGEFKKKLNLELLKQKWRLIKTKIGRLCENICVVM